MSDPEPRIFGIPAARAPVVAVLRRGPSAWSRVGRWDLARGRYEPGAWIRSNLYPQREPADGDARPLKKVLGLALTRPAVFAVERRHGWTETADSPPRRAGDMWDERRADHVTMAKPRPGSRGRRRLTVQGWFAAFREGWAGRRREVTYALEEGGDLLRLEGVQWADWSAGRLLVATVDGRLQVREGDARGVAVVSAVADLAALRPDPQAPPDAFHW